MGVNGTQGCDVISVHENRFALVDGKGQGNEAPHIVAASRAAAEEAAGRLVEHVLDTYTNGRAPDPKLTSIPEITNTAFISGCERVGGFVHGYARGGGYIVVWREQEGVLQPTVLYNGTDERDAPIKTYEFANFQPAVYLAVCTDGGIQFLGIPSIFEDLDVDFNSQRQAEVLYRDQISSSDLVHFLDPLTAYLTTLRKENRAFANSKLAQNMRSFTPNNAKGFVTDDAAMLLVEPWNTSHPAFTQPS